MKKFPYLDQHTENRNRAFITPGLLEVELITCTNGQSLVSHSLLRSSVEKFHLLVLQVPSQLNLFFKATSQEMQIE